VRRVWPYEYRAVFSPADVIEEYVRPSRIRECGRDVVVPALSGVETVDLPEVGTVEAFYTDGLRTLLRTIPARDLREKTLRYPGHAEKMRLLRESGFFDETPVEVDGVKLAPRRMTERLLFSQWELPDGEQEVTVLRVEVRGVLGGRRLRVRWDLFDRTDRSSGETSMARTTGFPCAIVARMLLDGRWTEPGVHPPEVLGRDAGLTDYLLSELRDRGVIIRETRETVRDPG
jgi:saccharopine dehydrogenase-like NADP-dependent oxidoreductase